MKYILCFIFIFSLTSCETLVVNDKAVAVHAIAETHPVASADDAADDPAIWIHADDPEQSLILGTDKKRGLMVYDLQGRLVQTQERGRLNNVDLRQGVRLGNSTVSLAVATNRTLNTLDIFSISDQGEVSFIVAQPVTFTDPYGVCMHLDSLGQAHAFANSKDGEYQQWLLNPGQQLSPQLLGSYRLDSQPEGCAADDDSGLLYVGEEEYGIWQMPADITRFSEKTLLDRTGEGRITADVEGMDVYRSADSRYLVASSQGDNSYAVYDLNNDNRFVGSFRVADDQERGIDGSEETDGLAVTSVPLGPDFPAGMLVVQDGYNRLPRDNQNFKLVSWQAVIQALNSSD